MEQLAGASDANIYARAVGSTGLLSNVVTVASGPDMQRDPDVGGDPDGGQAVVVWNDTVDNQILVRSLFVSGPGSLSTALLSSIVTSPSSGELVSRPSISRSSGEGG